MKLRRLVPRLALGAGFVTAGLGVGSSPAGAAVPGLDVFGVTAGGTGLVTLSTSAPSAVSVPKQITGLQAGETIVGIDVRPVTGQLFALGSTSRVYVINPLDGAATAVGAPFSPALDGTSFGFDFNPTVDRIRVTSNTGQNLRLNPNNGAVAAVDGALNGAATEAQGAAYTNSAGTATSTTLYDISSSNGNLYVQNPPNAGTLVLVGPTGLSGIGPTVGFDIIVSGTANKAIASLVVGGTPNLYEIDLGTGAATLIGGTGQVLTGLAVSGPTGYCGGDSRGKVTCVGGAAGARGDIPGLAAEIVDAVQTPSGQGVWQVAEDGGVFASGDAGFFGSAGNVALSEPIVGMAATPSGRGYWLVAADGGVFAYGDAGFFGSVPAALGAGRKLNDPVVGIASSGTGRGYWVTAADGGIFAFGDATFLGSVPQTLPAGQRLVQPVIGITRNGSGPGYYLVALDGGVFAFGGAPFLGSTGGTKLVAPIFDIESAGPGGGYRLLGADGGVFSYGAPFRGAVPSTNPSVGLAG